MTDQPQQEAFALVTADDLQSVCASAALGAFIAKRIEQKVRFGHSPDADLARAPDYLPRQAMQRVHDVVEILLHRDTVPPGHVDTLLKKVEAAGALLMATHDYLSRFKQSTEGSNHDERN